MTMTNAKALDRGLARASKSALFAPSPVADRASAVNAAIAASLEAMRPNRPWVRGWTMGTDYRFDPDSMPDFLLAIRSRLGRPPRSWTFTYAPDFAEKALGMTLAAFSASVDQRTR